jgi:hypothetical protein
VVRASRARSRETLIRCLSIPQTTSPFCPLIGIAPVKRVTPSHVAFASPAPRHLRKSCTDACVSGLDSGEHRFRPKEHARRSVTR